MSDLVTEKNTAALFVAIIAVSAVAVFLLLNKPATLEADGGPAKQANAAADSGATLLEIEPTVASLPDAAPAPEPTLVELASLDDIFTDVDPTLINPNELDSFLSARHLGVYRIVEVNAGQLRENIRNAETDPSFEIRFFSEWLSGSLTSLTSGFADNVEFMSTKLI